jgi:hypothetical protein
MNPPAWFTWHRSGPESFVRIPKPKLAIMASPNRNEDACDRVLVSQGE